jgi:hypothetical protein
LTIRRSHESAHSYTKRYFGSSRNNLHDELIADFCGLYAAFGKYRAEWFLRFLGLESGSNSESGRFNVYVQGLTETARRVIARLAVSAAEWAEAWSCGASFAQMDERERIRFLCGKDLLTYADRFEN